MFSLGFAGQIKGFPVKHLCTGKGFFSLTFLAGVCQSVYSYFGGFVSQMGSLMRRGSGAHEVILGFAG